MDLIANCEKKVAGKKMELSHIRYNIGGFFSPNNLAVVPSMIWNPEVIKEKNARLDHTEINKGTLNNSQDIKNTQPGGNTWNTCNRSP